MGKRISGLAAVLILVGLIGGIILLSGDDSGASGQETSGAAASTAVVTTPVTLIPAASPIPGASPIAGELDCTGIQAWTDRVGERFAETDAITASVQSKEELEAISVDELKHLIALLETAQAEQQADVPPSAGANVHQTLLALIQAEIDFFTAARDAKESGGDVGAVYDAHVENMQTLASGVSALAITLAFTCFDEFE